MGIVHAGGMGVCVGVCVCVWVCVWVCACVGLCVRACVHICTCVCIHVCAYMCAHTYTVDVCTRACMHAHTHVHTHTHTHTHTDHHGGSQGIRRGSARAPSPLHTHTDQCSRRRGHGTDTYIDTYRDTYRPVRPSQGVGGMGGRSACVAILRKLLSIPKPLKPLFSGWNCAYEFRVVVVCALPCVRCSSVSVAVVCACITPSTLNSNHSTPTPEMQPATPNS